MEIRMVNFSWHGDDRGSLVVAECGKEIPFAVKRIYYIYGTAEGIRRGFHAHKKLEQLLVCVHGSCKVLLDNGAERQDVTLDDPTKALYVGHNYWREMYDFSPDAVLMVFASELYDEADYIRNYEDFLAYVNQQKA